MDHAVPKEEAVFSFDPQMKPILEIDPGEVAFAHHCFSGRTQTENDLVTDIDY